MKGVSLPINAIIIIAVASIVLLVVLAFTTTNISSALTRMEAKTILTNRCSNCNTLLSTYKEDTQLQKACKILGYKKLEDCVKECECETSESEIEANLISVANIVNVP